MSNMVFRSFDIISDSTIPIIMFLGIVAFLRFRNPSSLYCFGYQYLFRFRYKVITFGSSFLWPFLPDTISETTM